MRKYNRILAHIPHSSVFNYHVGWQSAALMFGEVKQLTDWHTEILFHSSNANVIQMVFPYSRFYLDVERLENDPMEEIGQGRIYSEYHGFKRNLLTEDQTAFLNSRYHQWKRECTGNIDGNTLVVDCHSFTSSLAPDTDVCIGINEDGSKPDDEVLNTIINEFSIHGYRVAIGSPYSNPVVFGRPHHSVMIDLNKRIYMDEDTLLMHPKAYKVGGAIQNIYRKLLMD